jgi:hypothetical protein
MDGACGAHRGVYNLRGIFVGEPEGNSHLEDLGVDGMIVNIHVLKKQVVRTWTGFIWVRRRTSGGFL